MVDASYLTRRVRDAVRSDIVAASRYHSAHQSDAPYGGCFGIPRQVFCLVDFLGAVAYNNSGNEDGASTRKAVRFICDFFPSRYEPFAQLIVALWRHGTVHQFEPFRCHASSGRRRATIRWTSNNDSSGVNRGAHLLWLDATDDDAVVLAMNTCALADDLLEALDALIARMEHNPSFGRACVRRLNRCVRDRSVREIAGRRKGRKGQKRSAPSEVERILSRQVLEAPRHTRGRLVGDQVQRYD